jgi:hypothetical protein
MECPTYFDFKEILDDQGIPLFKSEADLDADRYGVTVTLEDYPASILIYYQYFADSDVSGVDYVDLTDIPENVHRYLINAQEHMVEDIFEALPEIDFNTKLNSRGYWRAIALKGE